MCLLLELFSSLRVTFPEILNLNKYIREEGSSPPTPKECSVNSTEVTSANEGDQKSTAINSASSDDVAQEKSQDANCDANQVINLIFSCRLFFFHIMYN